MRNFLPAPYGCPVRKGYQLFADGFAESIGTVMAWRSDDGSAKLFAVDEDTIYDATNGGTMTIAEAIVGSSNPWWQSVSFGNAAGVHLIAFNGVDDGFWYGPAGYAPLIVGDGTTSSVHGLVLTQKT